ncbi:MAG: biosynthetic-type acetolactate synthase large subunit [Chloroflexi bacterium]|nr:biosynthetic-type acetolactate synthase large subunit [Chloroflexota bacterium]
MPLPHSPLGDAQGKRFNGSQILCECLLREGVDVIFGIPGGSTTPLYDVLLDFPMRHILVRHEQAAAHAADGYARATGRVGVCLATSGPGATNLVTGIANAYLDSVPLVALTGQVGTRFIGKDSFQEVDITGCTVPVTKHNYLVERVEDIPRAIREAFYLASTGRPGPVLVDFPRDILAGEGVFNYSASIHLPGYRPTMHGNTRQIRQAAKLINEARKPVIVAGHGVIISGAYAELRELAEKAKLPVITTLLGLSCFPESHELSLGMAGMHGMAHANMALNHTDLVIAVGMRFDDRVTGKASTFAPHAQIIHIDIDPAEIGKNCRVNVPVVGDVKNVLTVLNNEVQEVEPAHRDEWLRQLDKWRINHPSTLIRETDSLLPQYVIRQMYEILGNDIILVTDVGQNQMWSALHFCYDKPNSVITSGGLGTMGFALPAAMGAKVGRPNKEVWVICGDGGFQMNLQELATLVQDDIVVKVAILNNGFLGMVRQWQDLFHRRRYSGTRLSGPDFVKIAEAYGVAGFKVTEKSEVGKILRLAHELDGPALIDFVVEPEENVFPMVPPAGSLADVMEDPRR